MKVKTFLFHIPELRKVTDYQGLEKLMHKRNPPDEIHVIDAENRTRLGLCKASIALVKYR